jgi:L-threonylcarbamoyladenylate synthase
MSTPALSLEEHLTTALTVLRRGGIIALPTDTIDALAALPEHAGAMRRLLRMGGRPPGTGAPLLLAGSEHLPRVAVAVPPPARRLIERFWPGPLTLLLRPAPRLSGALIPTEVVAVRVPASAALRALIEQAGGVLAVIEAGPDRRRPVRVDLVLDGPRPAGIASSIVDCSREPPRLVREAAIDRATLEDAAGCPFVW